MFIFQKFSAKLEEGSEESSSVHEINTAEADSNPHALVLLTFETIWNAVNQFRSLSSLFSYPKLKLISATNAFY